jgi:hypothetical protein
MFANCAESHRRFFLCRNLGLAFLVPRHRKLRWLDGSFAINVNFSGKGIGRFR